MDFSFLKQLAPTVAAALGGPLAGMAVEVVSKALGVEPDAVRDTLAGGGMTAEQVAALQQADAALKARAQEMGLDFERLAVQDRADARALQVQTKSRVPAILAFLITCGFFAVLGSMVYGMAPSGDAVLIMLGALGTAWASVVSFYFGSSASSQSKDSMLYNSTPTTK